MKIYLVLLPIFILALFQGAFLKLNLVLLFVLTWTIFRPPKEVALISFLAGLLLDLAKGTNLGLSSLFFLIASYFLLLYSRKFDSLHPVFLPVFVFLTASVYYLIFNQYWFWQRALILAFLALILRYLLVFFVGGVDKRQIKLQ